jgi:hypothetical protein
MRRLRNIFIVLVLIGGIIAGGIWYGYYRVIPEMVGKAIVQNQEPAVLPAPYKEKIQKFRKPVNKATEKILMEIDSSDIPFAAILRLIDNTEDEAVVRTYAELKAEQPDDPNEVFDIVKKNIPSEEFDLERFREPFLRYATMERYEYGMRYIENNEIIEQIEEMPYRQIVKEVLLHKRAEIDRRLKTSGGPKLK